MSLLEKTTIELTEEKVILTQMITNTTVLSQLVDIAIPKLFESSYSKIIASWIWEYFNIEQKAPGQDIQALFLSKITTIQDKHDQEMVQDYLTNLSSEYQKYVINGEEFSIKNAVRYFKLRSMHLHNEAVAAAVAAGDPDKAEQLVETYNKVDRNLTTVVYLLKSPNTILNAFNVEEEELFGFNGDLGRIIGPVCRGDFVAIYAPAKRGKTWWLLNFAFRATMAGRRALFITLEMTEDEMTRRAWQLFVGQPMFPEEQVELSHFEYANDENDHVMIVPETVNIPGFGMDAKKIENHQTMLKRHARHAMPALVSFPMNSATVNDIEQLINDLEFFDNYIPDVVVVDYADILKPVGGGNDYRHQIDDIWKRLRGLAQKKNIAMISASQTNKSTFEKDVAVGDASEDTRKTNHITKMLTLNQTERESACGLMRISSPIQRHKRAIHEQVVITQCLDAGRPELESHFVSKVVNIDEFKGKINE